MCWFLSRFLSESGLHCRDLEDGRFRSSAQKSDEILDDSGVSRLLLVACGLLLEWEVG